MVTTTRAPWRRRPPDATTTAAEGATTAGDGAAAAATEPPAGVLGRARRAGGARLRIVGWVLVLVLGALAVATFATWQLLISATDERMNETMRSELAEFDGLIGSGRDPATGGPFGTLDRVLQSAITYNLARPNEKFLGYLDGTVRYQSRQPAPAPLADDPAFGRLVGSLTTPASGRYASAAGEVRYLAVPVTLQNDPGRGVLVVAHFADLERASDNEAALVTAASGGVTALLVAAVAWLVAGRILRPVRDVATTARSITETDLSARIPADAGARDEIGELVRAVNAMLDRVEDGARAQRRFVDDAGHELRTPITIVRGHLDVLDARDPDDVRDTMAVVDDELDRMNRIVSDLLVLAKAEQPSFVHPEPTDVDALLDETLVKARALADRRWERTDGGATGLVGVLDAQRLTQALLVLADNAAHHTGPGDRIVLGARRDEGALRLRVADTGTGVAAADRDRIFERFARGDGSRRSDGAGLGLAIATAIAAAHGGRVELGDGIGGAPGDTGPGATFTLVLPHRRIAPADPVEVPE